VDDAKSTEKIVTFHRNVIKHQMLLNKQATEK